jgi:DNA anti-recombination protein RmuC
MEHQPIVAATMEAMAMGDRSPAAAAPAAADKGAQAEGGRMEAVVDLLFGNHLTEINANMRSLEKQMAERVTKVESEMRTRVESLDRHSSGEFESLRELIEKERGTREDAVGELGGRMEAAISRIEARLDQMEADSARSHELAQKDSNERLTKAAETTMQLRKEMEQEIANMKIALSTRAELAGLFGELSKRLDGNAGGSGLG